MTDSTNPLPLVSVLISSYNHADFVEASIRSVYAQSYPNIELLVVDDGSREMAVSSCSNSCKRSLGSTSWRRRTRGCAPHSTR